MDSNGRVVGANADRHRCLAQSALRQSRRSCRHAAQSHNRAASRARTRAELFAASEKARRPIIRRARRCHPQSGRRSGLQSEQPANRLSLRDQRRPGANARLAELRCALSHALHQQPLSRSRSQSGYRNSTQLRRRGRPPRLPFVCSLFSRPCSGDASNAVFALRPPCEWLPADRA